MLWYSGDHQGLWASCFISTSNYFSSPEPTIQLFKWALLITHCPITCDMSIHLFTCFSTSKENCHKGISWGYMFRVMWDMLFVHAVYQTVVRVYQPLLIKEKHFLKILFSIGFMFIDQFFKLVQLHWSEDS